MSRIMRSPVRAVAGQCTRRSPSAGWYSRIPRVVSDPSAGCDSGAAGVTPIGFGPTSMG